MSWFKASALFLVLFLLLLGLGALVFRDRLRAGWAVLGRWWRWLWACRGAQPLRPVGHLVAYYPLLVPGPLFLFAVCWNIILADFDAFHVLWNPDPAAGVLSGCGVALILGGTLLAAFLLTQARSTPPTGLSEKPAPAEPGPPPAGPVPVQPWAYWVLWVAVLVGLALPAAAPGLFFGETAAPFGVNNATVTPETLPKFTAAGPPAEGAGSFETAEQLATAERAMARARLWFPLGLLAVAAAFVGSRWAFAATWADLPRLRALAGWLLALFVAHHVLMILAHVAFGHRVAGDEWADRAAVRWAFAAVGLGVLVPAVWWAARGGPARRVTSRAGVLAVAVLVLWGLFWVGRSGTAYCRTTGAQVALLGLLGVLTGVAALVTYWNYPRRAWIVLAVGGPLTVPFLISDWQTDYHVPGLEAHYDDRFPLATYGARRTVGAGLIDDNTTTAAAVARLAPGRPLVVVAVSGGASASAAYTADILFTLEMQSPGFVDQVRMITGASGGSLGAAYFVAAFRPGAPLAGARARHRRGELPDAEYTDAVKRARDRALADLGRDFLGPLVQQWVYRDGPLYFLPRGLKSVGDRTAVDWGTTNDRGLALEQSWRQMKGLDGGAPEGVLNVPFADLRAAEGATGPGALGLPSLVLTPMMIEDGRQLLVSNLDLDYMVDSVILESSDAKDDSKFSHTALEFFRMFPDPGAGGGGRLRLSTAVRLNSSFPFLSPSAALPTKPPRHLVDGGYFDNYGTLTAAKWIIHNAKAVDDAVVARGDRKGDSNDRAQVVLLQLHCFAFESETHLWVRKDERDRLDRHPNSDGRGSPAALYSVVAPVIGALSSRRAHMVYRGDERLDAVNWMLATNGMPAVERVLIECELGPSLNWVLTPDTRRQLRRDVWERLEDSREAAAPARRLKGIKELLRSGTRPPRDGP